MGCQRLSENIETALSKESLKISFSSAHLGNVVTTVSDQKIVEDIPGVGLRYVADVTSATEYYPFGMSMPDRMHQTPSYRYGFQGQERDNELMNGTYAFTYRIHDPRTGRFLSRDPLAPYFPYYSSYSFSGNRPIDSREVEGAEPAAFTFTFGSNFEPYLVAIFTYVGSLQRILFQIIKELFKVFF